MLIYNGYAAHK